MQLGMAQSCAAEVPRAYRCSVIVAFEGSWRTVFMRIVARCLDESTRDSSQDASSGLIGHRVRCLSRRIAYFKHAAA